MPSSAELLDVARLLLQSASTSSGDASLRRAVSTAYYALFHHILEAAATRFMGPGQEGTAGYSLLYRGFDHRQMRMVCEGIRVPTLKDRFQQHLRRRTVGQDMRDTADAFLNLQGARHRADYDPAAEFSPTDVRSIIDGAVWGIDAFDRVPPDERADVLALMMVGARS